MTPEIRFIDPNYNDLFRIPDGGYIAVTRSMGEVYPNTQEESIRRCRYIDECHVEIDGRCFHICQFAELQASIGATIRPESAPEMVANYRITHCITVGEIMFKLGHNPAAVQPYATWKSSKQDPAQNDWGHYWSHRSDAWSDFLCRANAERSGIPYDHTKLHTKNDHER